MKDFIAKQVTVLLSHKKELMKEFLIVFLILMTVFFTLFSFVIYADIKSEKNITEFKEKNLVEIENKFIMKEFEAIVSDLEYLSKSIIVRKNVFDEVMLNRISDEWVIFSEKKKIYDQIRFLDIDGNEILRVNYNDGAPIKVDKSNLQNKKHRYYFKDTIKLDKGQVYISDFDLNKENNQIEQPIKPMIRFGIPVYSNQGSKIGIVIINYYGKYLINQFKTISDYSKDKVFLLNAESYWLVSDNPQQEWGFMYSDQSNNKFSNTYPEEWRIIDTNKQGQFYSENELITFGTIYKHKNIVVSDEKYWKIVTIISSNKVPYYNSFNTIQYIVIEFIKHYYFIIISFILALNIAVLIVQNKIAKDQIQRFATFDIMTGVHNRRAGMDIFEREYEIAIKNNSIFSICFIDINGLKYVNDTFGHQSGDELIKTVVSTLRINVRKLDTIIRLGGDEFLIYFPGIHANEAEKIWGRILDSIYHINHTENREYLVSISHGIEEFNPNAIKKLDEIISSADEKMYVEKNKLKGK